MTTCVQTLNRASLPINIVLTTVAVASAVVAAVALAVICSLIAPPVLLLPGAYFIIAIASGSTFLLSVIALVIKAICGTNQAKSSVDSEHTEELDDFTLPLKQTKNICDEDWEILSGLDLSAEKEEAISVKMNTGAEQQYIKISRRAYSGLTYSYILHKSGKIYRCTHKTAKNGASIEKEIGKGGYKTAYHCYDENDNPTLVRAVVQDKDKYQEDCRGFFEAQKQYPDDPYLITGVPHAYPSLRHKEERQVFYTPKMTCLFDVDPSALEEEEWVDIFRQILRLIERVHTDGGAHKDIKLENVFIDRDAAGEIKVALMDFDTYTRSDGNIDSGTYQMMPETLLGREDITLKECQEADVYATAFIALGLFGGQKLCDRLISIRTTHPTDPLDMNYVGQELSKVASSNPFFQKIEPIIREIFDGSDPLYRDVSHVLSEFNRKAQEAGYV